jgi:RING finger protein 113A
MNDAIVRPPFRNNRSQQKHETTMFRKPKRKGKNSAVRQKDDNEESETAATANSDEEPTSALLQEARKRVKAQHVGLLASSSTGGHGETKSAAVLQSYQAKESSDGRDLVTSVADHHPNNKEASTSAAAAATTAAAGATADGIFRDTTRNKFHAGPIRAATNIRTTVQFDYQPDVCKDYKETGFCGFGDTCIYLHDRGDTLSGWQIEQQWEEQQKKKKEQQEKEMSNFTSGSDPTTTANDDDANRSAAAAIEDGIPFACHLCRDDFKNPVVTNCLHYFCERCIMDHVRTQSEGCPVCGKDTGSVFNQPIKLLAKKRKLLGSRRASEEDSWQEYANLFRNKTGD